MITRPYFVWVICAAVVFQLSSNLTLPLVAQQANAPQGNQEAEAFELMDLLKANVEDRRVRQLVAEALIEIGEDAEPALRESMNHWDSRVHRVAVELLDGMGTRGISDLLLALSNENPLTRIDAYRALTGKGEASLPDLYRALKKPEEVLAKRPQHVPWAERSSGDFCRSCVITGRFGYTPLPHLRHEYEETKLRLKITLAVGEIVKDIVKRHRDGFEAPKKFDSDLVATMIEGLWDSDTNLRIATADALAEFGKPAAAALRETMNEHNPAEVSSAAVRAMAKIGRTPPPKEPTPDQMENPEVLEGYTKQLAAHRAAITDAAWGMDRALRGSSLGLQIAAVDALFAFDCENIETEAAIQVVSTLEKLLEGTNRKLLEGTNQKTCRQMGLLAVSAIGAFSTAAAGEKADQELKDAVKSALDKAKQFDDPLVRRAAAVAPLTVGQDAVIKE